MAFMVTKQRGVFSEVLNPSLPEEFCVIMEKLNIFSLKTLIVVPVMNLF